MKIGLASDHGGFRLKEELIKELEEKGYSITDYGTYTDERTDYPEYAFKLCHDVIKQECKLGIAICKTGIGMSIACNKVKGIRCAKIDDEVDAKYAKCHNNANVLAFSSRKTKEEILKLLDIFIKEEYMHERHEIRNNLVKRYEDEH